MEDQAVSQEKNIFKPKPVNKVYFDSILKKLILAWNELVLSL